MARSPRFVRYSQCCGEVALFSEGKQRAAQRMAHHIILTVPSPGSVKSIPEIMFGSFGVSQLILYRFDARRGEGLPYCKALVNEEMQARSGLASVPILQPLSEAALQELTALLRRRKYARGETIFLRGDPGVNLCIVDTGRVKLTLTSESQGREVAFAVMGPQDVFGELALLDGEPRSADAVAIEPTELLLLTRDDFLNFLRQHSEVALALLAELGRRLRRDVAVIQDATFLDVTARIARVILKLAEPQDDGTLATPRTSQSNLAALALTTRETFNQSLRTLSDQGLVEWQRGRVLVLHPAGLQRRIY